MNSNFYYYKAKSLENDVEQLTNFKLSIDALIPYFDGVTSQLIKVSDCLTEVIICGRPCDVSNDSGTGQVMQNVEQLQNLKERFLLLSQEIYGEITNKKSEAVAAWQKYHYVLRREQTKKLDMDNL